MAGEVELIVSAPVDFGGASSVLYEILVGAAVDDRSMINATSTPTAGSVVISNLIASTQYQVAVQVRWSGPVMASCIHLNSRRDCIRCGMRSRHQSLAWLLASPLGTLC